MSKPKKVGRTNSYAAALKLTGGRQPALPMAKGNGYLTPSNQSEFEQFAMFASGTDENGNVDIYTVD